MMELQNGHDGRRLCDSNRDLAGYQHPHYARSLSEFGRPLGLPQCGGNLLARPISDTENIDGIGCYPLFCCRDWTQLGEDLGHLGRDLVSVALVADPFGCYNEQSLRSQFDRVVPFKEHYVVDLEKPLESFSSATHRKFARRAQRQLQIEVCSEPEAYLDTWCELYEELTRLRGITGIRAFSRRAFDLQLRVPGTVMFRASQRGETVGLDLWYVQGDVAQAHLAATTQTGYSLHAGYGLKLAVIDYFKGKVRWLNLGGVPGISTCTSDDGLARFKRGWASGTRMAWFCGRILQPSKYEELSKTRGVDLSVNYFPAYRCGEFI